MDSEAVRRGLDFPTAREPAPDPYRDRKNRRRTGRTGAASGATLGSRRRSADRIRRRSPAVAGERRESAERELGRRAHYLAGTLSEAAGGRKLPSLAVTSAYVRAWGVPGEWEERWHAVAEESRGEGADSPPPAGIREIPRYVGLGAFTPADAGRFFGRERLIEKLVARLSGQRFLAVLGASGSGKSSLLRAGLLPAVKGPVVLLTPGARPLQECAVKFAAALGVAPGALLDDFTAHPRNLGLAARQLAEADDTDVVLVVDQFEEVFTLCQDDQERARFLAALVTATTEPGSRTQVVLGIRTDFYTHCARHAELAEAMQDAQVLVGPMTTEELRLAISRPAVDAGYRVENALVSRLVADATGQPGVLPLLSHALLETWRRRRGTTLTLAGYESTGGSSGPSRRRRKARSRRSRRVSSGWPGRSSSG